MGILEELEKQAAERRAQEASKVKSAEERERTYKEIIVPVLDAFADYVLKLTRGLMELKPERGRVYEMPGYGSIPTKIVHQYDVKRNLSNFQAEVQVNFPAEIQTEQCKAVEVIGETRYKTLHAAFQKIHLGGVLSTKKDGNGIVQSAVFKPRGKIPLQVLATGDIALQTVRLQFINFEDFHPLTKIYPIAQFKDHFETIGRYLAHEDLKFAAEDIPDKLKASLKNKVQQEQIKRKWEEKLAQQEADERAKRAEEAKFGFKLKQQGVALMEAMKGTLAKWTKK
jgi:hypothetical protein